MFAPRAGRTPVAVVSSGDLLRGAETGIARVRQPARFMALPGKICNTSNSEHRSLFEPETGPELGGSGEDRCTPAGPRPSDRFRELLSHVSRSADKQGARCIGVAGLNHAPLAYNPFILLTSWT